MIAFSTSVYVLGRVLGFDAACASMQALFAGLVPPFDVPPPACVETFHRLDMVADDTITLRIDPGAPHAKMRSRAYDWARNGVQPQADIWVACDDSCTADVTAIRALLAAVRTERPTVAIVPHLTRDGTSLNVHGVLPPLEGSMLAPITWGGFGLVAMNRPAMDAMWEAHPDLEYLDSDNCVRRAVFMDKFLAGEPFAPNLWYGEDASFWLRLPTTVRKVAICEGTSIHSGMQWDVTAWAEHLRKSGVRA